MKIRKFSRRVRGSIIGYVLGVAGLVGLTVVAVNEFSDSQQDANVMAAIADVQQVATKSHTLKTLNGGEFAAYAAGALVTAIGRTDTNRIGQDLNSAVVTSGDATANFTYEFSTAAECTQAEPMIEDLVWVSSVTDQCTASNSVVVVVH